ncbi:MAG: hypothetical protein H6631_09335 [Anaerolineaceae bacterium]|nr:hypothetical protein [Anaerolineaceae bacterium]
MNHKRFNGDQELNPVLLQINGRWHIVEDSRRSERALCGARVTQRGAHARLSLVGEPHVCPKCWALFKPTPSKETL